MASPYLDMCAIVPRRRAGAGCSELTEDIIRSQALIDMQANVLLISSLGSKMRRLPEHDCPDLLTRLCTSPHGNAEKQHEAVKHEQGMGVGVWHAQAPRRSRTKSGVHCFPAETKGLEEDEPGGGCSAKTARVWRQRSRSGGSSRVKDVGNERLPCQPARTTQLLSPERRW
ncbi:hypothetical protein M440DRAFT_1182189 [Trichoderma longibrachiatum ATCC 18648]|uniref:Uncharacterized protein n=1 Tax=Trichoderma longibrachiatum ATCC 18648 TaxID=983965 RepID=A0A2T4C8X5_TRILO|nr:hypothetical protein M440DRAFT_1182189 [Trichoderma longibrachiatum ATCC 18648]